MSPQPCPIEDFVRCSWNTSDIFNTSAQKDEKQSGDVKGTELPKSHREGKANLRGDISLVPSLPRKKPSPGNFCLWSRCFPSSQQPRHLLATSTVTRCNLQFVKRFRPGKLSAR